MEKYYKTEQERRGAIYGFLQERERLFLIFLFGNSLLQEKVTTFCFSIVLAGGALSSQFELISETFRFHSLTFVGVLVNTLHLCFVAFSLCSLSLFACFYFSTVFVVSDTAYEAELLYTSDHLRQFKAIESKIEKGTNY